MSLDSFNNFAMDIMACELCKKEPASVEVTYGSYQSDQVQILGLCLPCSLKHWNGDKICSLRKLVGLGIIYYSIRGIK